jgi:hypothetical protein
MVRKPRPHVRGREPVPDHIRDVTGNVVESPRFKIRLVCEIEKRYTLAYTRPKNPDLFISLAL